MGRITRRPLAEADLIEIWQYIGRDDLLAADRLLDEIEAALQRLSDYPRSGRARPELLPELRSAPVRRYTLFYMPRDDGIDLVRVLHSARDIGGELFGE